MFRFLSTDATDLLNVDAVTAKVARIGEQAQMEDKQLPRTHLLICAHVVCDLGGPVSLDVRSIRDAGKNRVSVFFFLQCLVEQRGGLIVA